MPDAVRARLDRSRVVQEGDHRFALLLEETVLHYRVCVPGSAGATISTVPTMTDAPARQRRRVTRDAG
ncbi:hypothetical protein AC230_26315 [Streptomyces caatingaensis]|uniref:Uncharacterized protein n=1 Tax=Streptomyces caatingaensis TaxID=1678637 RepID=A0A0K9XAU3_9ACTN|nr:hypothetical protein AC230_26315 [Streptomyces caatingaensis]